MRLVKFIGNSGYCSRRAAGDLVDSGAVTINDHLVTSFNTDVQNTDKIKINGQEIFLSETSIWLYHKPVGVITSKKDNLGRTTIFQSLSQSHQKLMTVGRLDYNSEGLLLMTNNGDLAKYLTDPKNNIPRQYQVKIFGKVSEKMFQPVRNGIAIDGFKYRKIEVKIISYTENNTWLQMTLTEGKNREIRNILNHLGLKIARLIRTEYAEFKLGKLPKNAIIKQEKLDSLYSNYLR